MSRQEYRERLFSLTNAETLHAFEDQTYIMAQLARKKLRWMNHGWWYLAGTIMFTMGFVVLSVFGSIGG